jgi:hypothetical protein
MTMAKYVLVYGGGRIESDEAAHAASIAAWGEWFGQLGPAVVDHGNPFGESKSVSSRGVDPHAGSALSGYSIVTAASLSAASDLAKGCPVLRSGGTVEVYETIDVM